MKKLALILLASTALQAAHAAPAIIDTPDAKIIVLRPIDQWTQDSSAMNNALSGYKDKEYKFMLKDASGKTEFLRTNIFSSSVDGKSPAMMAAYQAAEAQGWKTSMNPGFGFIVDKPVLVSGEQAEKALSVQKEAYTAFVESAGNPDDLQTSYTIKKVLGGAITIGITAFATDKLGGMFASNAVLGSGIATDIGSIPTALAKEMPFIYPPQGLPLKAYKTVEFRRVQGLNTGYGQVLIAYKTEKTAEASETALAKAIESLIGLDTNQQQIQSARLEDFNRRKTIWNECVASGKCAVETTNTNNQESR